MTNTQGNPDIAVIFEDGFDYLAKWEQDAKCSRKKRKYSLKAETGPKEWEQDAKLSGKKRKDPPLKTATSPKDLGDVKKSKLPVKSIPTGEH